MADTARLKQLAQTILKDPKPAARLEALLEIRQFDDPRVTDLLRHVSQKDRDARVRDLAGNLYVKKKVATMQSADESAAPGLSVETPAPETPRKASAPVRSDTWTCAACGGENSGGSICRFCGSERYAAAPDAAPAYAPPVHEETFQPGEDVFVMNLEYAAFVAGRARRPRSVAGLACGVLFMLPFLVIGAMVIGLALRDISISQALAARGIITPGTIADKRISSGDDSDTYYLYFEYAYNGGSYSGEQSVAYEVYRDAERGARVDVLLLPENPGVAKLAAHNDPPTFLIVFAILWNGICWTVAIGMFSASQRHGRLMREGRLIPGEVTIASARTDSDDDYIVTVEYAFRAPDDGTLIIGKQSGTRNDLKRERLPRQGAPVAVMYRNKNHYLML